MLDWILKYVECPFFVKLKKSLTQETKFNDIEQSESDSDGGIVFKDETPGSQILQKPAPSR